MLDYPKNRGFKTGEIMSEQIATLEKAANIAAESLKKIEAPAKAKAAEGAEVLDPADKAK